MTDAEQEPERIAPEERVRRWFTQQGFALEHAAIAALRDAQFRPRVGIPVRDQVTGKVRSADVVAMLQESPEVEIHVVVECKRPKHAWVARVSSDLPIYKGSIRWLPVGTERLVAHLEQNDRLLNNLLLPTGDVAFDVVESERPDPKETNPAHTAMLQVTSAAVGMNADRDRFPNLTLFHPVVLIDRPLYRAGFNQRGDAVVQATPYERVHWGGVDRRNPLLVDVVTADAFRDYLVWVRPQLDLLLGDLQRAVQNGLIARGTQIY